ncbi:MAG: DNA repair protein RecO [Candidatus Brocadiia bacterium]
MGLETVRALVINTVKFSDTSLIIVALTPSDGVLHFFGRGFRKLPKKSYLGRDAVETFSEMELTFYRTSGDLQPLRHSYSIDGFEGIRTEYSRLLLASFGAGLALDLSSGGISGEYECLQEYWHAISTGRRTVLATLTFWLSMLHEGGFLPPTSRCSACGGELTQPFFLPGKGFLCQACRLPGAEAMSVGDMRYVRHILGRDQGLDRLIIPQSTLHRLLGLLTDITEFEVGRRPRLLDQIRKICEN